MFQEKTEMQQTRMIRCLSTESLVADLTVKLRYTNQPYSEVFSLVKLYSNYLYINVKNSKALQVVFVLVLAFVMYTLLEKC